MDTFPVLHTPRLLMRKITVGDIPSLVKYANNKKISGNIINIPYPYEEPNAVFRISYVHQGFKNKQRYVFAIILKESEEFIGEISLHLDNQKNFAEIGYWIGEPLWNKGIAAEAVKAVLKFGFEKLNLDLIFGNCHTENPASGKVLKKNGMKQAGVNGGVAQYRLRKQEFTAISSAK